MLSQTVDCTEPRERRNAEWECGVSNSGSSLGTFAEDRRAGSKWTRREKGERGKEEERCGGGRSRMVPPSELDRILHVGVITLKRVWVSNLCAGKSLDHLDKASLFPLER